MLYIILGFFHPGEVALSMKVFVLTEPTYLDTFWCIQTFKGINEEIGKKRYEISYLDGRSLATMDWELLYRGDRKLLIVIGTSVSWIPKTLETLAARGIQVILVGYQAPPSAVGVSSIVMDHAAATGELVEYLVSLNKGRIALFGINPNSSADMRKSESFVLLMRELGEAGSQRHVYFNYASLDRCYATFEKEKGEYDAVICANDVVAVSLIRRLADSGTHVPEDLFIVSFGGTLLAQLFDPSVTSASLNYEELGRQAVLMFAYLRKNPAVTAATIRVVCKIHVRRSTADRMPTPPLVRPLLASSQVQEVIFYADLEVNEIFSVENFLTRCDELDFVILEGLMGSIRYSDLAERMSRSDNDIKYRIKRMLSRLGKDTKEEMLELLGKYLDGDSMRRVYGKP
jgi:DNA-binding LacI/PurR family transcriptional regulator